MRIPPKMKRLKVWRRERTSGGDTSSCKTHIIKNIYIFCKCGCGEITRLFDKKGRRNPYMGMHKLRGFKCSASTKEKISIANKGKKPRLGIKLSEEVKRKIGLANKGRLSGSKNHFYKGGFTKVKRPRKSYEVQEWRRQVFERDDYECKQCYARNGEGYTVFLEAHHPIQYSKLINTPFAQHIYNIDNGITLCRECHKNITRLQKISFASQKKYE